MKKVIFLIIVLILIGIGVYGYQSNWFSKALNNEILSFEEKETPKLKIYNMESTSKPFAVMMDNNTFAWPHSSLDKAYVIYEMNVEGGETRLMALFKDQVEDIPLGPVRSARHYFLDYALEHDAIYAHIGQSPKAESDINTLGIKNINGQAYDSTGPKSTNELEYWRSNYKQAPHNSYTSFNNLLAIANSKGYNLETNKKPPFNYTVAEHNIPDETALGATSIKTIFHPGNIIEFTYNETNKMYTKTSKGVPQIEEQSQLNLEIKNLIVLKTEVTSLGDASNPDRRDVKTVGTLNGYYITNGRAEKITAVKNSRAEQTKYFDSNGKEILINDGLTYISLVPNALDADIVVDGPAIIPVTTTPESEVVDLPVDNVIETR